MKYFTDLADKKVLVTGGSRGIGKDMALAFAELGAQVVIVGRDVQALQQTVNELKAHHTQCYWAQADVSKVRDIERMIQEAVNCMGSLDVLVNNAGTNIPKPSLEVTEQDWDQVLDTNLKSAFFCAQGAARYMIPQKKGKIINIASQMAFVGYPGRAAYCSSKGGMMQLTKALAVEWAPHGINVNAVAPTFINTEFTETMFRDEAFSRDVFSRIPMGRLADKKDVTAAVLFLSSDLTGMITGETLKVDGGWTAI
jgi:NAD(P)-dependent dehydrogenase (short-subunit alcohol dehydrogenase family)